MPYKNTDILIKMRKEKNGNNLIQITAVRTEEKQSLWSRILTVLFALFFTAEFCLPAIRASINKSEAFASVPAVFGILTAFLTCLVFLFLFLFIIEKRSKRIWIFALSGVALSGVLTLVFRRVVLTGATVYYNAVLSNWNVKTGSVVYYNDFPESGAVLGFCLFMGLCALLITSLSELLVYYERKIELLVLGFLFFAALWLAFPSAPVWPAALTGMFLLLWIVFCAAEKGLFGEKKTYYVLPFLAAVLAVAITLGVSYAFPDTFLKGWQAKLVSAVEDLSFGKSDLTDGDLKKAKSKNNSSDLRLAIETEVFKNPEDEEPLPEKEKVEALQKHRLYLRGFIGAQYTGSEWKDLEDEAYQNTALADNLSFFQWLASEDGEAFLPISSVPKALEIQNQYPDKEGSYEQKKYEYRIENVGASQKYLYYPELFTELSYESAEGERPLDINQMNRDLNVKNSLISHVENYSAKTLELPADEYISLLDYGALQSMTGWAAPELYLQKEQNYSSFADQTYNYPYSDRNEKRYYDGSTMTSDLWDFLYNESGIQRENDKGAEEIIWLVREYLEKNLTYSDHPKSTFRTSKAVSEDYVVNFLKNDKEGFSVQYATAATMIFRYLGLPARYVEGYMVRNDADSATAADAHAWVEIYRYGFGWIPVEVTPGYFEIPEERRLLQRPPRDHETSEVQEAENLGPEDSSDQNSSSGLNGGNLWWLWVLLVLVALVLALILRRFIALKMRDKKMHGEDLSANIRVMARYIRKNSLLTGVRPRRDFPKSDAPLMNSFTGAGVSFEAVSDAMAHAFYSREGATQKDADTVERYLRATEKALMEPAGFLRKLRLKFVDLVC